MRNQLLRFAIAFIYFCSLQASGQTIHQEKIKAYNQGLADELSTMAKVDQIAAYVRQGIYKEWTVERWNHFKDSVFTTHKKRLEEIFYTYGYPGYSLVGELGSQNFWLMVQHCDFDPIFQSKVLEKLKVEVDHHNADGSNYALLTDRVKINTGEKQIYGTQVTYNTLGQAYLLSLADSVNVNQRRSEVGLEPLEEYLNNMTQMHFEMNKDYLKSKGVLKPTFYKTQ